MKLEDQVASLELSKKLKELGVKQDSALWWENWEENGDEYVSPYSGFCSAFTVAELGEMLPSYNQSWKDPRGGWWCGFNTGFIAGTDVVTKFSENEANARAKMLIHLIEQGIVKPHKGDH